MFSTTTLSRSFHRFTSHVSSRSYSSGTSLFAKKRFDANKTYRADRVLSNRGWGSRSECFELLKQRRVFQKVDSGMQRIQGPSEKLSMEASLWIDRKTEVPKPPPLLRIYNKPKWVLSVMHDSKGRKNVGDLDFVQSMHPVGRLDYDSSGLLLFSSDGILTQQLLHPTRGIEKEYVATVVGRVDEDSLREQLAKGVETSLGAFPATLVEAMPVPSDEVKPFISGIVDNLPEEYDLDRLREKGHLFFEKATELSTVRLIVKEGKHRMVRKILANSGFPVIQLRRERLGVIMLGDLEQSAYRDLTEEEQKRASSLLKKRIK